MAELIGVVGRSGTGKTRSVKGLDPKETFILSVSGKALPIKGWKELYTPLSQDGKTGNYCVASTSKLLQSLMLHVSNNRPEIKNIVVDDYQYCMAFSFFDRVLEKGYEKFNEIGKDGATPLIKASGLRADLKIFILTHEEEISENFKPLRKIKTLGKMIDDKLTIEGLFTVVLFTNVVREENGKVNYTFITNTDGTTTAKSPEGMFEFEIPNDLGVVAEAIDKYYN